MVYLARDANGGDGLSFFNFLTRKILWNKHHDTYFGLSTYRAAFTSKI